MTGISKPTRYIGNELNAKYYEPSSQKFEGKSLIKEDEPLIRIALAFPDVYEVGMSHLGLKILYDILNSLEDVSAERVYTPWIDMEEKLRSENIELFSLESFSPLQDFDIIGFSLQYEMCYTNILNMLDLAKIPLLAKDRNEEFPLVIAGGPCTFNPEPIADFIDLFAIGDGEEVILDIVNCYKSNMDKSKYAMLIEMSKIEGIYVPSLSSTEELPDGTLVVPNIRINKRVVNNLDESPYPINYIIPFMKTIHDRAVVEVMRGCSRGCRFCQAGMIYRPVRERSLSNVSDLADKIIANTGYEELSLSSLSTCDHSSINSIIDNLVSSLRDKHVAVSLPSLRTDAFSIDLARKIESIRKTGLTFAPEVGTERLQKVINKGISEEQVLTAINDAFSSGWESVKLYFMIGLPTETDEDVAEIAVLAKKALKIAMRANRRASLNISVSTFVPKAHTPFQWESQLSMDEVRRRQKLLMDRIGRNDRINVSFNSPQLSFLEGIFARGDRRLSRVLIEAWLLGCKLDGWTEFLNFGLWMEAFRKCEIGPNTYTKSRDINLPLPWDHINSYIAKDFLLSERDKAYQTELTSDCRSGKCGSCGACDKKSGRINRFDSKYYEVPSRAECIPSAILGMKKTRIRLRFAKRANLRFISHLDLINVFTRAFRRAQIPIAYSHGYNPHPKISFGSALAVGMTSEAEFADIDLEYYISPKDFIDICNSELPIGLEILQTLEIPTDAPSLMSQISFASYLLHIYLPEYYQDLGSIIQSVMSMENIWISRSQKPPREKTRIADVRPYIRNIELLDYASNSTEYYELSSEYYELSSEYYELSSSTVALRMLIGDGANSKVRPEEVANFIFNYELSSKKVSRKFSVLDIHKTECFIESKGQFFSPMYDMPPT